MSVGGLKINALEAESPTYAVFCGLLPSFHAVSDIRHPIINFIGLLKLKRVLSEPEFNQVHPKQ